MKESVRNGGARNGYQALIFDILAVDVGIMGDANELIVKRLGKDGTKVRHVTVDVPLLLIFVEHCLRLFRAGGEGTYELEL